MRIYLDFDGTVVEHTYPSIGKCNAGSIDVIKKLQEAGHELILNTMRVEFNNGSLEKALDWFNNAHAFISDKSARDTFAIKLHGCTKVKWHPTHWDWQLHTKTNCIYIDDICPGIPLIRAVESHGWMVDWHRVDGEFKENGVYK